MRLSRISVSAGRNHKVYSCSNSLSKYNIIKYELTTLLKKEKPCDAVVIQKRSECCFVDGVSLFSWPFVDRDFLYKKTFYNLDF